MATVEKRRPYFLMRLMLHPIASVSSTSTSITIKQAIPWHLVDKVA